jgi:hypothetical protein
VNEDSSKGRAENDDDNVFVAVVVTDLFLI